MKNKNIKKLYLAVIGMLCFVLWTVLVKTIDVEPIGPNGSFVGFSAIINRIHLKKQIGRKSQYIKHPER